MNQRQPECIIQIERREGEPRDVLTERERVEPRSRGGERERMEGRPTQGMMQFVHTVVSLLPMIFFTRPYAQIITSEDRKERVPLCTQCVIRRERERGKERGGRFLFFASSLSPHLNSFVLLLVSKDTHGVTRSA